MTSTFLRTDNLAAELKVSHTPVREALMGLQGSVRWEPRRGFRVVSVSDQDVRDHFQVPAWIAGELAARAATELDADRASGGVCGCKVLTGLRTSPTRRVSVVRLARRLRSAG